MPLITSAGGRLLDWGLGDPGAAACAALVRRCWRTGGHPLGPALCEVVERDGVVVACLIGAPSGRWTALERQHPIPVDDLVEDPRLLHRRLALQRQARPPLPEDAWYLASLAVAPTHRRLGLARALLTHALERARRAARRRVLVEVVAANDGARAFYEATGWSRTGAWAAPGGPRILRLDRSLSQRPFAP